MEYYGNKKRGGVNGHIYHVFNTVSSDLNDQSETDPMTNGISSRCTTSYRKRQHLKYCNPVDAYTPLECATSMLCIKYIYLPFNCYSYDSQVCISSMSRSPSVPLQK